MQMYTFKVSLVLATILLVTSYFYVRVEKKVRL